MDVYSAHFITFYNSIEKHIYGLFTLDNKWLNANIFFSTPSPDLLLL